ncbi:MAG: hypothetical protein IJV13_03870 [Prevotella sp.]|nr:hypothetical protein [Prevotella sp.]
MKKSLLLLVALVASFTLWAQEGSWSDYRNADWGSDYESTTEFIITDAADFAQLAYLVNNGSNFEEKTVTLAADLDLGEHYWVPVGSAANSFAGTFDGSDKTIRGLYVSVNSGYIGLFGDVELGTVKNLSVVSGCVEGSMSVGTIVGGLYKGTVTDCFVGDVTVRPHQDELSPNYFGGIVGTVTMGTVSGCHSQATVTGSGWSCGGIVGVISGVKDLQANVEDCLYDGPEVSGTQYVGAIVGQFSNYSSMSCCYFRGVAISAKGEVINEYEQYPRFSCYTVTTDDPAITISAPTNIYNYDQGEHAGVHYYVDGYEKDGDGVRYYEYGATLYADYDTSNDHEFNGYVSYGEESSFSAYDGADWVAHPTRATLTLGCADATVYAEWGGEGTEDNPYQIVTPYDLNLLSKRVNEAQTGDSYYSGGNAYYGYYFKQMKDLDYSGIATTEDSNYTPVGYYTYGGGRIFSAAYDGQGHTISGITINTTAASQGIFGFAIGDISNLTLTNSTITGGNHTGGIVGYYSDGTITNCHVGTDVTIAAPESGTTYYHSGILGNKQSGTLTGCTSAASVTDAAGTGQSFGGIVGWNYGGRVLNSLYLGENLDGDNYVGAVAGRNSATITNCYHTLDGIGGINGNDVDGQAMRGYTVKGSSDIVVELDESSLVGLTYNNIYAGVEQEIILRLSINQGDWQNAPALRTESSPQFVASSGSLTDNGDGTWTLAMAASDVTISIDNGTVTAVTDLNTDNAYSGQRYNLMGQPVGKDYKGIVIEDGKKVIVR